MSKGPRAKTFVFLDLEATGLPSVDPEIAELSLFAVHRSSLEDPKCDESGSPLPPRVMDKLTLCMSPKCPFTAKAREITGLSREGLGRSPSPRPLPAPQRPHRGLLRAAVVSHSDKGVRGTIPVLGGEVPASDQSTHLSPSLTQVTPPAPL